jgi:hypothetical protein
MRSGALPSEKETRMTYLALMIGALVASVILCWLDPAGHTSRRGIRDRNGHLFRRRNR